MIYNKIIKLLLKPNKGIEEIYLFNISKIKLFLLILLPLTFFASIISIIRLSAIGVYFQSKFIKLSINISLLYGVYEFILLLLGTYLSIWLINALIKSFKYLYPSDYTYRLVIYSIIPAFIGELFFLFPKLSLFSIFLQLYSFYLLYKGLNYYYKGMGDKTITIFLLSILILLFIFTIVFGILNNIIVNVLKVQI
jgi:hypothetical protein